MACASTPNVTEMITVSNIPVRFSTGPFPYDVFGRPHRQDLRLLQWHLNNDEQSVQTDTGQPNSPQN